MCAHERVTGMALLRRILILIDKETIKEAKRGSTLSPDEVEVLLAHIQRTLGEANEELAEKWLRDVLGQDATQAAKVFGREIVSGLYLYDKMFLEPVDAVIWLAITGQLWTYIPVPGATPTISIPEGTEWVEGPCGTYIDLGLVVNLVQPKFVGVCTFNGAAPPPIYYTDAEINFALSGGNTVGLSHVEPYGLIPGTWAYSGFGTIIATNPAEFEEWDSARHGLYEEPVSAVPMYDPINDAVILEPLNEILENLGLEPWENVGEMLREIVDTFGQPETWTDDGLPFPDIEPPVPEPIREVELPEPEGPVALNNDGSFRINEYSRKNDGFRLKNKRVREKKAKVERGLWRAMNAFGAYSELGDAVNALWKAMPKRVQKEAFKQNGYRHLLWEQKLLYIIANADQLDVPQGIARVILSQIDDFVSAKLNRGASPYHRDWKTRFITRRAWNELHESANMPEGPDPSVTRWLERHGWLEKN